MTTKYYNEKKYRSNKRYDDAHYKHIGVKVPLDIYSIMQKDKDFINVNQYVNTLIKDRLTEKGLIADSDKTQI